MNENTNEIKGWRDVTITPEMPLNALIQFLNILNQRLATLEDLVVYNADGEQITVTEAYRRQTEAEMKAAAEAEANKDKEPVSTESVA